MKPQTVQIVRQGEATPYWFKVNPLYFCPVPVLPISGIFIFACDMAAGLVCFGYLFSRRHQDILLQLMMQEISVIQTIVSIFVVLRSSAK